jgi:hypothetical protein
LPIYHKFIKNRNDFFIGIVERNVASPLFSGEKLYNVVSEYGDIEFGFQFDKQKFPGFGLTYDWVKQSILLEFFYCKTNIQCHNLDVIHIENNVFKNIFNMVMDVKGTTKDNIKARINIALSCHCKNIEFVES